MANMLMINKGRIFAMEKLWGANGLVVPLGEFIGWIVYVITFIPTTIAELFGIRFYVYYDLL